MDITAIVISIPFLISLLGFLLSVQDFKLKKKKDTAADVEKEKEIKSDYSFLLNDKFMFVVMRKENEVYISEKDKENGLFINLNSLAFYFIIVSRTQEQIDEMKQGDIIKDVLSKL